MIVCFHAVVLLLDELFTPEWQKNVRHIARDVVECLKEQEKPKHL